MKRFIAVLLCAVLLMGAVGCSRGKPQEVTKPAIITEEVRAQLDQILLKNKFTGIVRLTHNGEVIYESVSGTNGLGEPLTVEAPMLIGSISKQFCAAAVVMLRDQGKLDLQDSLSKYFPEYTIGKDITLKQLLTMRSGIFRDNTLILEQPELFLDHSYEDNLEVLTKWIFAQPLNREPDTCYEYSNINYLLLSLVVEKVSGQRYQDFIQENIFDPLGMTHSTFTHLALDRPELQKGIVEENLRAVSLSLVVQGCGDIVTTAADMGIWMDALPNGKVVCEESYQEMIANYSPELSGSMYPPYGYGYGLETGLRKGVTHGGNIAHYTSKMYFHEEYDFCLYMISNDDPPSNYRNTKTEEAFGDLLAAFFAAYDKANR